MTDLAKLKALAEAATPGPWRADFTRISGYVWPEKGPWICNTIIPVWAACGGTGKDTPGYKDTSYIAAANPTTILALIERVEELERERNEMGVFVALWATKYGRDLYGDDCTLRQDHYDLMAKCGLRMDAFKRAEAKP